MRSPRTAGAIVFGVSVWRLRSGVGSGPLMRALNLSDGFCSLSILVGINYELDVRAMPRNEARIWLLLKHESVKHGVAEFVRGRGHTNGV